MKIKAIYKKNLKMPEGKVASQISHAVKNLGITPIDCSIIVLKVSTKKFNELTAFHDCYIQKDLGLTVVEAGTETAAAWIEVDDRAILNCYWGGWNRGAEDSDLSVHMKGIRKVAYSFGSADYIAGDDVSSVDLQTDEEIIQRVRNYKIK